MINEEQFTELVRDTILGHSEVTSVSRRSESPPSYLRNPPNAAKSVSALSLLEGDSYSSSALGLIRRNSAALLLSHAVDGTLAIFLRSQADSLQLFLTVKVIQEGICPITIRTTVIVGENLERNYVKETCIL